MFPLSIMATPARQPDHNQLAVVPSEPMSVVIIQPTVTPKKHAKWIESALCVLLAAKREDMDWYKAGDVKEKLKTQRV